MAQTDTDAWWTEVEHLRERIERRRATEVSYAASRARRAAAEGDAGSHRRPARAGAAGADLPSLAPRRTVQIHGRAAAAISLPRLRVAQDAVAHPYDDDAELAEGARAEDKDAWDRPYGTRRRPRPRVADRLGRRPDRMALWAFALAMLTVLIALLSAH